MTISAVSYSADSLASLSPEQREMLMSGLSRKQLDALTHDWQFWARSDQIAPAEFSSGQKSTWLLLGGRGAGKTRSGSEQVRKWSENNPRILLVAPTPEDARDVMVEGESGILTTSPPWWRPGYNPSKKHLTWPNGARGYIRSGADPESLRGPNFHKAWADELRAWKYPQETWDNLQFALRLRGRDEVGPQAIVTTTARPIPTLKQIIADPGTVITRASTYANRAYLAESFFREITRKYAGTRLGDQELWSLMLEDTPGALWKRSLIDAARMSREKFQALVAGGQIGRTVVGVDPAVTSNDQSHETGIVTASRGAGHWSDHLFVVADASCRDAQWPNHVVAQYETHEADRVAAEKNNGGDMVESTLRVVKRSLPVRLVTASKGKRVRAEPVVALYEKGLVHHVGTFGALEDEMTTFIPDEPETLKNKANRVDALVWAGTELMFGPRFLQT